MLNPALYHALSIITQAPVKVSNEGRNAKDYPKGHEEYQFTCPRCGEPKAYCSYQLCLQPDLRHVTNIHSWKCFSCGATLGTQTLPWLKRVQQTTYHWRTRPADLAMLVAERTDPSPDEDTGPSLPYGIVRYADLPERHPARLFTAAKYRIPQAAFDTKCFYAGAYDPENPLAKGRVIWPVTRRGELVGWQGRDVTGASDIRWAMNAGMRTAVWNLDTLNHTDVPVVCEGIPAAMAAGATGVAIFGKELKPDQINDLKAFPKICLMLDAETYLPDPRSGGVVYTDKARDTLLEAGIEVEVFQWPQDCIQQAETALHSPGPVQVPDPADYGSEWLVARCPHVIPYTPAGVPPREYRALRSMPLNTSQVALPKPPIPGELWVYDIEVLPNYFMLCATDGTEWVWFYHNSLDRLRDWLCEGLKILAGYNNAGYDDLILTAICDNPRLTTMDLYGISQSIIMGNDREMAFELGYRKPRPWAASIDVMALLPGRRSLKELQASQGFERIFESPIDFDLEIPNEHIEPTRAYCSNDVAATRDILIQQWDKVALRETLRRQFPSLGHRIFTMTEPKIAERLFMDIHRQETGETRGAVEAKRDSIHENTVTKHGCSVVVSKWVKAQGQELGDIIQNIIDRGHVVKHDNTWNLIGVETSLRVAGVTVQLGVGGLHSEDGPGRFDSGDGYRILDFDVGSMYPSIIIAMGLGPPQLGDTFRTHYKALRDARLKAKAAGDTPVSNGYKLALNAFFGKLNDRYSPMYAPLQAWRVTLNGQLFLMMLMETLDLAGAEVLSCNTDGVTVRVAEDKVDAVRAAAVAWEQHTRLSLEEVEYTWIVRRDVNNYIALVKGGDVKTKGIYGRGNANQAPVVRDAVRRCLVDGVDVRETITDCRDILAFAFNARVRGATIQTEAGTDIGSITRWVVGSGDHRLYRSKGDKRTAIGGTVGAVVIDDLTTVDHAEVRARIDEAFYVERALAMVSPGETS